MSRTIGDGGGGGGEEGTLEPGVLGVVLWCGGGGQEGVRKGRWSQGYLVVWRRGSGRVEEGVRRGSGRDAGARGTWCCVVKECLLEYLGHHHL
ncbi:hypothetical protein Pmani_016666 [Petrolisthes manimaculis]|uniref:Uncharacterized protein n=1 Tax=Petrolisthes manimaculis TaxID=1843537 RepID=A0AAE1U6H6_9EUCA|nr:hypothetical protein Pmani_016666 [Petrolisthes manimaculis]